MSPHHWFQFGNDSALVTSTEEASQLLLNAFTNWCTWSLLIIKVVTFGIKKYGSKSIQFKPHLQTNNELIPSVKIKECFVYLGKECSFDMKPDKIKETLLKYLNQYMEVIDRRQLHPKNKKKSLYHAMFTENLDGTYQFVRYLKLEQSKPLTR